MNSKHVATAQDISQTDSVLSALADGEVSAAEFDAMFGAGQAPDGLHLRWQSYQLVGEVLRGQAPSPGGRPATDFLAGVHARLQAESAVSPVPTTVAPPASVEASPALPPSRGRAPAANDAVFRWQLVAGVASLAAVMAVSWTVLGGGAPGTAVPGQGAQLALVSAPAAPAPAPATVVVQTGQGAVIRDARLQELLAEHRQYGGMSALQMPAGFLRNATYDAAPQR